MVKIDTKNDGRRFFVKPEIPLGEPKRKFSETFSAITLIKENFKRIVEEEKTK